MMRRAVFLVLLVLGPLAACESKQEMSPESVLNQAPDPAAEEKRLRRPPPVRSGLSSDPDNPSGAPGSARVGSSPQRY
ncbi:MAG TPA: hypothetical protein VEC60_10890 [Reyranella sp.]|nr:hypothetical protein [Reyranella sp.]